jgi:glutaredoxin 1
MQIVIYTKPDCPWCVRAKELMKKLNLKYDEKKLDEDYTRDYLRLLVPENLPLTVPQVFVDGNRIGGYEDFADWCDNMGLSND